MKIKPESGSEIKIPEIDISSDFTFHLAGMTIEVEVGEDENSRESDITFTISRNVKGSKGSTITIIHDDSLFLNVLTDGWNAEKNPKDKSGLWREGYSDNPIGEKTRCQHCKERWDPMMNRPDKECLFCGKIARPEKED